MSRASTVKQKINRNLRYLLLISEHMAELYKDHQSVFYTIESISHFPLLHRDPLWEVSFDEEIQSLEKILNNYSYKANKKILLDYYNCVVETNDMIKWKYKFKIKKQ